jgi:hypothetical protein
MKTAWEILREESIAAMGLSRGKDEALGAAYQKYLDTKEEINSKILRDNPELDVNNKKLLKLASMGFGYLVTTDDLLKIKDLENENSNNNVAQSNNS